MTDDDISEILLSLMPLKDPYVFARAIIKQAKREALLERASYYETRGYLGTGHELARELTEKAKELE